MTSTTCPSWCHTKHPEGETGPTLHYGPHWPPLRGEEGFSADVAILVLHSSDVGRETFFTSQRWPVRPVMEGRSGLPLGMLGVAPAWTGCGGHACSLRQPQG